MKTFKTFCFISNPAVHFLAGLIFCLLGTAAQAGTSNTSTNEDFSLLSKSVVELLQSRDTARFATDLSPSIKDWQPFLSTNATNQADIEAGISQMTEHQRQDNERTAKLFLEKIDSLHLDFSKGKILATVIPPTSFATTRYVGIMAENETVPCAEQLEVVLTSDSITNVPAGTEFKAVVRGLVKFPGGWRSISGVQWSSFPASVMDVKTRVEMAILNGEAAHKGITGQDDPSLLKLGDALVRFISKRDMAVFTNEAYITTDLIWDMFNQTGRKGTTRKDLDEHFETQSKPEMEMAGSILRQMEEAGIDLEKADIKIKEVAVKQVQSTGSSGLIVGLVGNQFELTLAVKTDAKSKNGTPLAGDYVLSVNVVMRFADGWRVVDNIHWSQMPTGVLGQDMASKMEVDKYVAENGTLPPWTTAPDIEFTTLDGEKKMKLSDLHGKIVVLDFWASWCGPCQQPMTELQTLRESHPDWKDHVAIVPLSIDETMKAARDHIEKRSWTNTFNVWAGEGGWQSKPVTTFRVRNIPTTYIIDTHGLIIRAGPPATIDIDGEVAHLIGTEKPMAPLAK